MSRKVLIAAPVHEVLISGLIEEGYECIIKEKIKQEEAFVIVKNVSGIITSTRLDINKELIDIAPKLEWIGRMGSGMEIIDVDYAKRKGISCYSSPEGNRNAVAEHALGMLLALNKKVLKSANEVKDGKWLRNENRGIELEGKTIGIIGFGNTGGAFAKVLSGFDVKILAYDKYKDNYATSFVEECTSLNKIFEQADIISFHVPWNEETHHYFNDDFLSAMRKHFVLINTSRGSVVKTEVLLKGLIEGRINGSCIDVWEEEPITKMSYDMKNYLDKIAQMEQVIITPHIAGYSHEALYKMSKILLNKIVMIG